MADPMRNNEKVTYRPVASFPSVESLLRRLNNIDVRLRQLEEKVRPQQSCFSGDHRARNELLTPTMDDAHVKHTLMNRLQLLETKICKLSKELHKGSDTSYGVLSSPTEKQKQKKSNNNSRRMVRSGKLWRSSAENVQKQRSKKVCCTASLKRALRWMRSCNFCTGDEHCCLTSSLSDDCEAREIHAGCYH